MRRGSMWLLASGVAAIAAIVSYSHIYDLGRAHGGSGAPARLLPLSVDMLILAGELMLLHEADAKGRRFLLGWVLVWSGILATLAANVTYGYQFGVIGAIIWGWPAYSFILAAAGMVSVVKRGAARNEGGTADGQADRKGDTSGDEQEEPAKPRRRSQQPPSARARAAALLKRQPDLSDDDVMKKLRVSRSTVERARKDLQKENAGHA